MKKVLVIIAVLFLAFTTVSAQSYINIQQETYPAPWICYPPQPQPIVYQADTTICIERQWLRNNGLIDYEINLKIYPTAGWKNILQVFSEIEEVGIKDIDDRRTWESNVFHIAPDVKHFQIITNAEKGTIRFEYVYDGELISIEFK